MNSHIIFAMVKRYVYTMKHDLNRLSDTFYEPAMQIFIWGITGTYIQSASSNLPQIVVVILSGVVFWLIITWGQYSISVNLLQEFWDRNLVNIFASPMRLREWIVSVMIVGCIKMAISMSFAFLLVFMFYKISLFTYGFLLIPFTISLLMTGWVVGFTISALIIRFGQQISALAWIGITLLAPFSAIYYPVSALPFWMQKVAMLLPPSYIFEGMREVIQTGQLNYNALLTSFALNVFYLILSIWFFKYLFEKSRRLGLGRLI